MSQFYNDSIFWIDVEKIHPNPFQPRREFDQAQLQSLSDSIRQYGVLQALVVTRKEVPKEDGGLAVEYELIAGERRLRAAKMAGLSQVPVLIKVGDEENDLMKLELAIIENIQREDLNPVDRSRAFQRLIDEFGFKHVEIAKKVGKSREYVSNSVRLLSLPSEILDALSQGKISEGHARPLMMLGDRLDEQMTLFKEIMFKKLTVREAEAIGRRVAYDKIRKKGATLDPETQELEEKLTETLGTRVSIEKRENGGKILIDFFSADDLRDILTLLETNKAKSPTERLDKHIEKNPVPPKNEFIPNYVRDPGLADLTVEDLNGLDDRTPEQKNQDENSEEEIYSIKNFSI
ncbi:MAG: ParB/RepB/Spo0J family partition protein [Candidatus Paceibacterota bacterium]|jgi:ParB family chromosome partitioning protein